jgi:mitogen-activated protein kinase kinase
VVGYSDQARGFVRACLHKTPKLRPTYAMLIRHPWLAPLLQPPTISEDDEDAPAVNGESADAAPLTADQEVGAWVTKAMARRRLGKMGKSEQPALHAAPLDAVSSPDREHAATPEGA